MEVATVEAVIGAIQRFWHVDNDVEISLEANPTSVEATRFYGYRTAGVSRLSTGVQSLDDKELKFLGRLTPLTKPESHRPRARYFPAPLL